LSQTLPDELSPFELEITDQWAEVCVNTPLGRSVGPSLGADRDKDPDSRTFTYRVPAKLAGRVAPGHLVWVPFRSRRLQGIVMSLVDRQPDFATLDIEALVWAQPVLTPIQLQFARWISAYYLAPLIEALRLMLPARITQRGRTVLARTRAPAPHELPPHQAALLARIAESEGTWLEVSNGLKVTQRDDLEPLIALGLVTREVAFANPPPRPKFVRRVRLLADANSVEQALPALGRPSLEAEIIGWLAAREDPLPALADLCRDLGCTPAETRRLAARGLFAVLPPRAFIRRAVSDENLPQVLKTLERTPKRASALGTLTTEAMDEAEFRAACQADAATLKALLDKGLVLRDEEPAQVSLTMDRADVREAMIRLRRAEKQAAVLRALAGQALAGLADPASVSDITAETGASLETLQALRATGLIAIEEEMVWRDPLAGQEYRPDRPPLLTPDQERVWGLVLGVLTAPDNAPGAAVRPHFTENAPPNDGQATRVCLLHGVTGSGKTEIYLHGIAEVLRQGRQTVVLVPEIALTPQTVHRFAARFPGQVTVWHSELSDGERFDMWRRVRTGHAAAQVVVGSRSALFLPFPNLGLIVVDEEHESSYKQISTPRYHARTAAIALGKQAGITVLLGSATPALETYYAARLGAIRLLSLPRRVQARTPERIAAQAVDEQPVLPAAPPPLHAASYSDLPRADIVDMRHELRAGNRSMFSRALSSGLRYVLAHNQQAILYLNRRGNASFVMCRDCGHVEECPRCALPLTHHLTGNVLICHHCNRRYPVPVVCPKCGSRRIRYFGSGTQNVEEAVKQEFPSARTLRWDRDVTGSKGAHEAILSQFSSHQADVLIGTQMIAKGLDLPLVTLVGVIAADTGLFLPDFRAGERTFQLLTQVAGRAGRSGLGGQVIIQTYHPDHYAILAAGHHDFEGFYRQEMAFRRQQGYPPLRRLARLLYQSGKQAKAEAETGRVAELLRSEIQRLGLTETDLVGPAPCFFAQQRGEYRWQVVVRSPDPTILLRQVALEMGWRIDIDPTDLL
jgi:primosomal protein N' (replication factor Y) (superfamily II helicase)